MPASLLLFTMHHASLGEKVPDSAVEHAGIEVDAIIPCIQHELVLMVDQLLLSRVVCVEDVLPVMEIKEIVSVVDHLVEVVISVAAVGHRSTEIILRILNVCITGLISFVVVFVVRLGELCIELVPLIRATDDVVALIDLLVSIGVKETSVPLSGSVCG